MSQRARRSTHGNPRGAESRWVWLIARVICGPCAMKNAYTYSEGGRPVGIGIRTGAEDVLRIRKMKFELTNRKMLTKSECSPQYHWYPPGLTNNIQNLKPEEQDWSSVRAMHRRTPYPPHEGKTTVARPLR